MAKVVGIIGLAGAGKDTVAQMLQRGLVGAGAKHVVIGGFADYLRRVSKDVGLDPFNRDRKELPHVIGAGDFTDRCWEALEMALCRLVAAHDRAALWAYLFDELDEKFLKDGTATYPYYEISPRQFMQTLGTAGRKVRDSFWIDLAQRKWQSLPGVVLVTDCRFDNEAAIADQVLIVVRNGLEPVNAHVSEQFALSLTLGEFSIPGQELIDNNSTLEDLEVEVATMATSFAVLFSSAF
jgi:hypothetical protein